MPITYKLINHKGHKRILLLFEYDANKITRLKENTDAKWSRTHAGWHIGDTADNRIKCKLRPELVNEETIINLTAMTRQGRIQQHVTNEKLPIITAAILTDSHLKFRIELVFAKNQLLQNAVKKIKGAMWNSTKERWHIACNKESFSALCSFTEGIAQIDEKLLRTQLRKIKLLQKTETVTGNLINAKSNDLLFKTSHYNLLLLKSVMEHLQLKAYSTSTQKTYRNEIAVFLQSLCNIKADSLTTQDIRKYIHDCIHNQKLSENTIHSRLNALKFMYEQVLGHNRFFVEIPRPKKQLQLTKVLGEEELRRLFAAPKNLKHKAILFVAYSAGLRVSEVINLRLQDIDRERKQLFIHCSKGKKDRYVRLSPMVLDVLEQYYKMSTVKPKNYLFEGMEAGKPYTIRSAQQIFTDAKNKAGIIKSLSFHNLRHSFATHLLEKGVDILFIKEILGHFNIETTQRYLHVKKEFLINIESPLDDLYKNKPYI